MVEFEEFMAQFEGEEPEADEEAMEKALYGEATKLILQKAHNFNEATRRYQEKQKERNRQAMLQAEQVHR